MYRHVRRYAPRTHSQRVNDQQVSILLRIYLPDTRLYVTGMNILRMREQIIPGQRPGNEASNTVPIQCFHRQRACAARVTVVGSVTQHLTSQVIIQTIQLT